MKFKLMSFLLVFSSAVFANELCEEDENNGGGGSAAQIVRFVEGGDCPNKKKLRNICMNISRRTKTDDEKDFVYRKKIYEAACIDITKDSESVKQEKIKKAWALSENDPSMKCSSNTFDVVNGSVIKFAVISEFEEFVDDAIKWKVNLNKIDESDGRTVLDYIQVHIQKHKGKELEERFKYYYNKLKQAGAKHRSEL